MIIAIDGPAGSGKSSTAKALAKKLVMTYLDTGAMYRAVAFHVLQSQIDPFDDQSVARDVEKLEINFKQGNVCVNGVDVHEQIRKDAVNKAVTPVSANPKVRRYLVELQKKIGRNMDIVVEGRDIGTVVFPEADYKFFMLADIDARAKRRKLEAPEELSLEEIRADILRRDEKDSSREHSPLRKAEDAIEIDTSNLTFEEQIDKILSYIS